MRIVQANLTDAGGAFSFIYQLQKALNGIDAFSYYCIGEFESNEVSDAIYSMGGEIFVIGLSSRLGSNALLPFRFYKEIKNKGYRCVHIHADSAWKLALFAVPAKIARVNRVMVHSHNSSVNGDYLWIKKPIHFLVKPILPLFSDVMLACSTEACRWMYPRRIFDKVCIIKNGIDIDKFGFRLSERKKYRALLNIKEDEVIALSMGDFSYQKNPKYIIDVFDELFAKSQKFKLLLLGSENKITSVETYSRDKKCFNNIVFYGYASNVDELLNAADFFLMPSRFEGLPVSAIEAQTNGLFSILSDSITGEVAMKNKNDDNSKCVFWSINDAPSVWAERIVSLFCNYEFSERERLKGKMLAKQNGYDIYEVAEKMHEIYKTE